jgi:hypothetical protein
MLSAPKALPIAKFARMFGVHYTTVWRQVKAGELPYVVIGKRKFILLPIPTYQPSAESRGNQPK